VIDFGLNKLIRATHVRTVKGPDVIRFVDSLPGVPYCDRTDFIDRSSKKFT